MWGGGAQATAATQRVGAVLPCWLKVGLTVEAANAHAGFQQVVAYCATGRSSTSELDGSQHTIT